MSYADGYEVEYRRLRDTYGLLHPSISELRHQIMTISQLTSIGEQQRSALIDVVKIIDEEQAAIGR